MNLAKKFLLSFGMVLVGMGALQATPASAAEPTYAEAKSAYYPYQRPNSKWHSFQNIEGTNQTHRTQIENALATVLADYTSKTLFTMYQTHSDNAYPDVRVYATHPNNLVHPTAVAQTSCITFQTGTTCSQFDIAINENKISSINNTQMRSLLCHEILHTLGFIDIPVNYTKGCVPQSGAGRTDTGIHLVEADVINDLYSSWA